MKNQVFIHRFPEGSSPQHIKLTFDLSDPNKVSCTSSYRFTEQETPEVVNEYNLWKAEHVMPIIIDLLSPSQLRYVAAKGVVQNDFYPIK